ncbi:Lantibiotic dehydratase, C terminus [Micromonospora matsumotoense]|uniref:Lantibiotic dehydratase, C terminus n=1 Tax=Micromonospora matsumotoense TaxID=121616 RepID=A0A1C4Z796_9ACTN|nr:lantibiotic dehydratase [Micromonospora matsumotoense]SCF28838.1 Lantibiotic dehydratase, C terminus [Micromonospora matsumotoense]
MTILPSTAERSSTAERPATTQRSGLPARRLGRYFAVRVGGLPYDTVTGLRCGRAAERADEVLDLEAALAAEAATLSDLLHDLVGANEDGDSRRRLLALRRQVFKGSLPADLDAALATVAEVAPTTVAPLRDWLTRRQQLAQRLRELDLLLGEELARSRTELWRLSGDPRLRAGMQVASPALDQQLVSFAGRDGAPPAKKLRRVERSVLSYLYRTACKTSPFSSFTGIGVGEFTAGATEADLPGAGPWHGYARLNVVALTRIVEAVCADLDRRGDLPVALSPGLRQDPERVRYVRRWITPGDDSVSVSFDSIQDGLFYLRRSGLLDQLTGLLQGGTRRCAELAGWLHEQTQASPQRCEEYLTILLRLGILQIDGFAVDVHTPDPLRQLHDFLTTLHRAWADDLALRLAEPIALVETFRQGDLADRRRAIQRLRESLHDIQVHLGVESASLPQALLYEDCRIDQRLTAPEDPWQRLVGHDLAAVEAILPAFDLTLPHRITFHGFFLARYGVGGRCDDLLRLVEDFHEDLYDQYLATTADRRPYADDGSYQPEENWLGRPELSELDGLRQDLTANLRAAVHAAPDAAEIRLDVEALHGIGDRLGDLLGGFRPQSHLVQVAQSPDGPLVVVNQSLGGLSFPFSRFTHCFDDTVPPLSGQLRGQATEVSPPGAVFAEVTGGPATTNLNLHARLTEYVIVCPGETSLVPEENQLPLADLYLHHDVDTDRVVLRSTRLGREVIPVYLGYLVPMALPQLHRALLLLSPTSMAVVDVWRGVPESPDAGGVTRRPRVRVGDVVVSRRSWSMTGVALPRRTEGDTDAAWFLGWQRWRRAHGLPARLFATVHAGAGGRVAGRPKPQYVDCDSYLSLLALEALVTDGDQRVVFREMLPSGDGLTAGSDHGRHVTEFVIETFPPTPTLGAVHD